MNEVNKDIGSRIKELRDLSDITVEEMANELEINKENYISYEKGIVDFPARLLYQIAHVLQIDLALLLLVKSLVCLILM